MFKVNLDHLGDLNRPLSAFSFIDDLKAYYGSSTTGRTMAYFARMIAKDQGVIWSTGGHTATPVTLTAYGPHSFTKPFGGLYHSTEIYTLIKNSFLKE